MAGVVHDEGAVSRRRSIAAPITVCVMLATIMQALDTTIANVALPYMQGSLSASADQINWVLTSYIVAAAIMTPPTGWLAGRFGRKRVFLVAIAGFTVASVLCGVAQSLDEMVAVPAAAGLLRRGAGAALAGHPARHLPAGGARLGDGALGRGRDGRPDPRADARRLADRQSQLALGVLHQRADRRARLRRHLGSSCTRRRRPRRASSTGSASASLSVAIGALQLMLDRGEQLDWFSSLEILIEAVVAASRLLPLPRAHLHGAETRSSIRGCSSTATSRSGSSSSSSSASPTSRRWRC